MRKPDIAAATDVTRQVRHLTVSTASMPLRYLRRNAGLLRGLGYRLLRRHPDTDVDDRTLADRVRSTLGPLEKRLDIPHVHVMVVDHVVSLHGDVATTSDAEQLEQAAAAVSGVRGVESKLHVGLLKSDARPSSNRRPRKK
jgi:hypothetical protein